MNPKKIPTFSAAILLAALSPIAAQAQDEVVSGGSFVSEDVSPSDFSVGGEVSSDVGTSSFFFPGGYGYLPETIAPGVGSFGRSPAAFSFTLQQGYDDNIYSATRASRDAGIPRKGSLITQASIGTDLLISANRTYLALGGDIGALFYWDKDSGQVSPVGHLNLAYAYNFTPRLHFTSRINAGYYSQPDLSLPNAPTRPNAGDYFNLTSLYDLGYQWTPLFATDTTLGVNTQLFRDSQSRGLNYVEGLLGQSFRYKFAPRFTGVFEVRGSKIWYNDGIRDSTTESFLLGIDSQLTPRLNAALRGGISLRQFEFEDASDATSPYGEAVLGYRYGRGSIIQWSNRFGFEESTEFNRRYQAYRTSLAVNHALSARLSANIGVSYAYQLIRGLDQNADNGHQHLVSGNVGLQYVVNQAFTVFGSYSHQQVVTDFQGGSYDRNQYWLGASYQF